MPPQEFDFNSVSSKMLADSFSIRIIGGLLHLAVQSGQNNSCFVFPLPQAKFLGRAVLKPVEEIEQKNGIKIDVRLPDEPMLSPWTSPKSEDGSSDQKK